MVVMPDKVLRDRLGGILRSEPIARADYPNYKGTGAPGNILEEILGIDGGNSDTPDAGKWEIKFCSKTSLMTLFHKQAEFSESGKPSFHMQRIIRKFGIPKPDGNFSFRHTISGKTAKGFYVVNDSDRIRIANDTVQNIPLPYWKHDTLINTFVAKLRRLVVVYGTNKKGMVDYQSAFLYSEPYSTNFVNSIETGLIVIDFDVKTINERSLRDHGTKFRIKHEDISKLYSNCEKFDIGLNSIDVQDSDNKLPGF